MRKVLIALLLCAGLAADAQEVYTSSGRPAGARKKEQKKKERGFDASKIVAGGMIGLGFGSTTSISIAPVLGYRITDNLAAGVGFGYQYLKVKDYFTLEDLNGNVSYYDYKASMISASVWARYLIMEHLFAHLEYEHNFMSFQDYVFDPAGTGKIVSDKVTYNVPSLLAGVGYRQPISDNASMYIMGMYDVLQQDYSPYKGSIFPRIGFTIGF